MFHVTPPVIGKSDFAEQGFVTYQEWQILNFIAVYLYKTNIYRVNLLKRLRICFPLYLTREVSYK
jgi:hypothetical protein